MSRDRRAAARKRSQAGQQRDAVILGAAWIAATLELHATRPPKAAVTAWDLFATETLARFKQDNTLSIETFAKTAGVYRQRLAEGADWLAEHGFIEYLPGYSIAGSAKQVSYVRVCPNVDVPLHGEVDARQRKRLLANLTGTPVVRVAGGPSDEQPARALCETGTPVVQNPHAGPAINEVPKYEVPSPTRLAAVGSAETARADEAHKALVANARAALRGPGAA